MASQVWRPNQLSLMRGQRCLQIGSILQKRKSDGFFTARAYHNILMVAFTIRNQKIRISARRASERRDIFMKKTQREITDYDEHDTTSFIDKSHPLKLHDLGFKLPKEGPQKY